MQKHYSIGTYGEIAPFIIIAMYWKEAFKVGKGIVLAAVVKTSCALVWATVKGNQIISLHEPVDVSAHTHTHTHTHLAYKPS